MIDSLDYSPSTCSSDNGSVSGEKFTRCRFPAGPPTQCPICNDTAFHHHFGGVVSCNGCAAFFRRTIVEQKSYKCRRQNSCSLSKIKGKTICKYCRFKKCLDVGMVMRAVESKRSRTIEEKTDASPLQALVRCLHSNFTIRHKATIDIYGGQKNFKNMSNTVKSADSMLKANNAEIAVLQSFLHNSGLITPEDRKSGFANRFLQSTLMTWITCESLYANIKQLSFRTNRCYFLDDSYITLNEDQVLSYYRGYRLLWPEEVTRNSMCFYKLIRDLAEKMHNSRIDDYELAVFTLILLLKHGISMSTAPKSLFYQEKLNELFKDLKKHYEQNYECTATRLGNLILFMECVLGDITKIRDEMIILMRLNDQAHLQYQGTHNFLYSNSIQPPDEIVTQ
ncbi:putative Nuclear hormone receptor,putative [Aphelenchoides bicaudatus]|nr:putative Nuclear hormone receptor,putative [Aphelenchoides bicaudatus]